MSLWKKVTTLFRKEKLDAEMAEEMREHLERRQLASAAMAPVALDPLVLAGAPALFTALVVIAAWLPARRAAKVDPMVALRAE